MGSAGTAKASNKQMLALIDEWMEETGNTRLKFTEFSEWAVLNNKYQRPPISAKKQCEEEARRAIRQATYVNPQGIRVRTFRTFPYEIEGEQLQLEYVDVRIAAPDVAEKAFDHDHRRIANDVKRHSIEKQSYDDNNLFGAILKQYSYDFNDVAEDAKMSGVYDDSFDEESD